MFTHSAKYCRQYTGCALANITRRISELCYKFPVEALFLVLYIDGYQVGAHKNVEGSNGYFIAADVMMSFACMETIANASATPYAVTLMNKI